MILTYKIKHNRDFSDELSKARQVAEFALRHNACSTAMVRHIGLKSAIANQLLRKYGRDRKTKKISNVNLIVPGQGVKNGPESSILVIPCLELSLSYKFSGFSKINQVELSKDYAFVSVTVPEQDPIDQTSWIGVDLNTTRHCCVVANPTTGKVLKLGKKAHHIHEKYKNQRRRLQKRKKLGAVRKINNREHRIIRDLNHRISRKVVDYALENNSGIVLEDLFGIRRTKKQSKSSRYSLHSWSFYQFQKFVEYKAKLLGVPVVRIDPAYTSQQSSRSGLLGNRNGKYFECLGHVEDADVNAAFCIALRYRGILRLPADRDVGKGSTDTPQEATV